MLIVHFTIAVSCTLIDRSVLIIFLAICYAVIRHKFYIYLNLLSRIIGSLIRLWLVRISCTRSFIQFHSANCTQHCLIASFVALFTQSVPQHYHIIIIRIMTLYEVVFLFCLLCWMMFRAMRMLLQTPPMSIIFCSPSIY